MVVVWSINGSQLRNYQLFGEGSFVTKLYICVFANVQNDDAKIVFGVPYNSSVQLEAFYFSLASGQLYYLYPNSRLYL